MGERIVPLSAIHAARAALAGHVHRTPMLGSAMGARVIAAVQGVQRLISGASAPRPVN